jgi:hypothetical protein
MRVAAVAPANERTPIARPTIPLLACFFSLISLSFIAEQTGAEFSPPKQIRWIAKPSTRCSVRTGEIEDGFENGFVTPER